ncbi:MAG TPA: hypothetical protein PLX83_19310 [bacterium]|nr:hypothetical protein [bacterium]
MIDYLESYIRDILKIDTIPPELEKLYDRLQLFYNRLGGGVLPPQCVAIAALIAELHGYVKSVPEEADNPKDSSEEVAETAVNDIWLDMQPGTPVLIRTDEGEFDGVYLRIAENGKIRIRTNDSPPRYAEYPHELVTIKDG